jgi:putative tryptophan/tyrosine transport system substrate-binding protein
MKCKVLFLSLVVFLLALAACGPTASEVTDDGEVETGATAVPAAQEPPEKFVIGMMTLVSHPSLDAVQQGVRDKLAEAGFVEGENIEIIAANAEGDIATLSTIVQQFIDEDVDLIVATTTPAAQAAYNATKDAGGPPIIFNAVSNPYIAGLATAPDDHPAWILGNQLLDPVAEAMGLLKEIVPDAAIVGIVYNPAEANSSFLVEMAQEKAGEMGLTLELATVSNSSEVQTAAESLLSRDIDGFLAVSDNTLSSAFEALAQVANDNDLPIIGTSASYPGLGATASYGVNPYEEGLDSGQLVVDFLNGRLDIATATIAIQDAVLLTLNPAAAAEQGVELPSALRDRADKIIE